MKAICIRQFNKGYVFPRGEVFRVYDFTRRGDDMGDVWSLEVGYFQTRPTYRDGSPRTTFPMFSDHFVEVPDASGVH